MSLNPKKRIYFWIDNSSGEPLIDLEDANPFSTAERAIDDARKTLAEDDTNDVTEIIIYESRPIFVGDRTPDSNEPRVQQFTDEDR